MPSHGHNLSTRRVISVVKKKTVTEIQIPKAYKFLFEPKRYKAVYGGRGKGASHNIARVLLLMGANRKLRIVCGREIQKSIKDSVHKLFSDVIRSNATLAYHYEVLETEIRGKNGTEITYVGLRHNVRGIKSLEGVDIFFIEEAENVSDGSYEILIPTIRKEGSEIWAAFNVKNISDPTYRRFISEAGDDTIAVKLSWRDNKFFPDVLRREMEKLRDSDYDAYQHIWEGMPDTRRSGAVYAKQLAQARTDGRITRVPYDPACEVFTAWDLGFGDATSIWWLQFVGRELRWLECYENSGEQLDHYARIVKEKPYNYRRSGHYLPHDAEHGNIRGGSVSDQLRTMGLQNTVLQREASIDPGIELLRQTIVYSAFDGEKCKEGLRALENYGYEWDDDRGVFKSKPRHDWSSHYADSARYAAIAASQVKSGLMVELVHEPGYAARNSRVW